MIWTERHDDQLFVFWNGRLIYKRWLRNEHRPFSYGLVLDKWGVPWKPSDHGRKVSHG